METTEEIKNRIDELKWKALPPFERLTQKKESVHNRKFRTKERLKELRWFVLSSNVLIGILSVLVIVLAVLQGISNDLIWFFLIVLAILLAQKIELNHRLGYLKEVRFLKKILKDIK